MGHTCIFGCPAHSRQRTKWPQGIRTIQRTFTMHTQHSLLSSVESVPSGFTKTSIDSAEEVFEVVVIVVLVETMSLELMFKEFLRGLAIRMLGWLEMAGVLLLLV